MEPQQPAQPPSNNPPAPPTPPSVPSSEAPVPIAQETSKVPEPSSATASTAPPPIPPAQTPVHEPPHAPPKNNIPIIMIAVLFVLLVGGGILAFMLRPQSGGAGNLSPTPVLEEPTAVPTEVPTPTVIPTKTPEEQQIDTIDIGTDEAVFNDIRTDINQL